MSTRRRLTAAILLVLASVFPTIMDACSTVTLVSRCDQSWSEGELVFLGKAVAQLGGETPLGNGIVQWTDFEFHFAPLEVFRGANKDAKDLVVYTGHGGGDCSEPFLVGATYLVYARMIDRHLQAWGVPVALAGGTLGELRAIARGERPDDLFGTVGITSEHTKMQDQSKGRPLVNVVVTAVRNRGARVSTRTDEQGGYAFASLPPGNYQVEVDPGHLKGEFPAYIHTRKASGTGCRVDVFRPIADQVSVTDSASKGH